MGAGERGGALAEMGEEEARVALVFLSAADVARTLEVRVWGVGLRVL